MLWGQISASRLVLPDKKPDIPVARAIVLRADRMAECGFGILPSLPMPPASFAPAGLGGSGSEVERGCGGLCGAAPPPGWSKRGSEPPRAAGGLLWLLLLLLLVADRSSAVLLFFGGVAGLLLLLLLAAAGSRRVLASRGASVGANEDGKAPPAFSSAAPASSSSGCGPGPSTLRNLATLLACVGCRMHR